MNSFKHNRNSYLAPNLNNSVDEVAHNNYQFNAGPSTLIQPESPRSKRRRERLERIESEKKDLENMMSYDPFG